MNKLIERLEALKLSNDKVAGMRQNATVEAAISVVREMCEAGEVVVPRYKKYSHGFILMRDRTLGKQYKPVYGAIGGLCDQNGTMTMPYNTADMHYIYYADNDFYACEDNNEADFQRAETEAQAECERRNKEV